MGEILVKIDGELRLLNETDYQRIIRSSQDFVLIGRIERKVRKNKITLEQGKLILKEMTDNMKYFNNIPFGEIHHNFKTIVLKNLS